MINLTDEERDALVFVLDKWRKPIMREIAIHAKMTNRIILVCDVSEYCSVHSVLPSSEKKMNAVIELLYEFLVIETMNECRHLLTSIELKRLETLRTLFAKILANAKIYGRELNIGSIYLVPAELVKIGLHKMLQYPEIELCHYARKSDGGMLRVIAQYLWRRDFCKKEEVITH